MRGKSKTWNERLNWALGDRSMRHVDLARACKMSRPSVTEWTNGTTKNPRLDKFFAACGALRLRPRWLALGEEPIDPLPDDAPPRYTELVREIADMLGKRTEEQQRKVLGLIADIPEADHPPTRAKDRRAQ